MPDEPSDKYPFRKPFPEDFGAIVGVDVLLR